MKNLIYILVAITFMSCKNYTVLTQQMVDKYHLNNTDLSKIQVYTSGDITLNNKLEEEEIAINNGVLVKNNHGTINNITIAAFTPGIITRDLEGKLLVSFDANSSSVIVFGSEGIGSYKLMADWDKHINNLFYNGKVFYNDQDYYVSSFQANTQLLINEKDLKKIKTNTTLVKGNKIK
jgi:hypothetical protein